MEKKTIKDRVQLKSITNNNMKVLFHYYYENKFYSKYASVEDLYNNNIAFNKNRFFKVIALNYKSTILSIKNKAKKIHAIEYCSTSDRDIHSYINPLPFYNYNRKEWINEKYKRYGIA